MFRFIRFIIWLLALFFSIMNQTVLITDTPNIVNFLKLWGLIFYLFILAKSLSISVLFVLACLPSFSHRFQRLRWRCKITVSHSILWSLISSLDYFVFAKPQVWTNLKYPHFIKLFFNTKVHKCGPRFLDDVLGNLHRDSQRVCTLYNLVLSPFWTDWSY